MSARPPAWRTGLFLLVLLSVCAAAGWTGIQQLISPLSPTTVPCEATTVMGSLDSSVVTVNVYNTGGKRGLAATLSTQLKGKGFNIDKVANSTQVIAGTLIIGGAADAPEVQLVANFFPDSQTESDGRTDHTVDVLVNDDFGTFDDQAPTEIPVGSAVICTPTGSVTATSFPVDTGGPTNSPTATPTGTATSTPKSTSTAKSTATSTKTK